jgi:hypothetical protein
MHRFKARLYRWAQQLHHRHPDRHKARREARRLYASLVGDWELKRPVWLLFLLYQVFPY